MSTTTVPRPEFIDNRAGNTLAEALRGHIAFLTSAFNMPIDVSIATGYFNPEGFARIADQLEKVGSVRLLLGAEPVPPPVRPTRRLGEPRGARFEAKLMRDALELNEKGLRHDRDLLPFTPDVDKAVRRLLDFLATGKIEVRRYEKRFLHGKAFIFSHGQGVIAGSSNFTGAGLTTNLELNLGHYQPGVVEAVGKWFDSLWEEAVPFDLASIYQARYEEYPPYLIYLRVLWERYGAELEDEAKETGRIQLTRFQTDGLARARRILARYNGVLIADSVGLGKTFLAGELLTEVIERNRQRALLIAPAALRDGTWARFKARFQLGVEVRSYEEVAQGSLAADPDEYSLIVVDEAHAFRNPDTTRARALRRLIQGDPPKKVVLMTATPVNNSLWDLYDLLGYFVRHDAAFADLGIPSLKKRFDAAAKMDPFTLKPDVLFDVLDATTVRRTRHFVQRFYPHDRIKLKDGTELVIQFPTPHVRSRTYDLEDVLPGFFDEFAAVLAPEEGEPGLTMARYFPSRYRRDGGADAREAALVGLIRSGLLKRFESSARAFAATTAKMVRAHDDFLDALDQGVIPAPEALAQVGETDTDEAWEELLATGTPIADTDIDVEALRRDVAADREILARFHERASEITRSRDPKLELLADELARIAAEAERKGVTDQQKRDLRKVLIFSYYADTVEWIMEYLKDRLATDHRLAAYRGRIAAVHGDESYDGVTRRQAVFGFAPQSSEAPPGQDEDLYDILVTTDVLSEGMNLQQAARIINYDLPWNPMRLVQRHGRIDRIGSPHSDVYITCIFPDRQLESLLALEDRIRRKLAQAAASVGLEQEVIPGAQTSSHVFSDTLEEIERLKKGDADLFKRGGEDVHAHSGEEYRQELRKGLERWEQEVLALPGGARSGLRRGTERGHFFCAKIDDRTFLRFVPLDGGEIVRDSLACLARISCSEETERVLPPELEDTAYEAWMRARHDIYEEWQRGADPANLQPDIRPLFRAAANHVRTHPADLTLEEVDRLAESLEAPWGLRIENSLRKIFTPDTAQGDATTRKIAAWVKEQGLQPFKAPDPLPPIDEDEVRLVVWMGLEAE
ncbi:MAG TPA: helicase-related protein [Longimicrobiales bacterium]|nr:helicase-related protein [Longimicrobiales bacterium]